MLRCQCPSVCPSVRLSVTEVHWRIIANLGFKFRSNFTAHCGRVLLAVLVAGESSRAMLASARLCCITAANNNHWVRVDWMQFATFATSIDTWWTRFVLLNWLKLLLAVLTCATADHSGHWRYFEARYGDHANCTFSESGNFERTLLFGRDWWDHKSDNLLAWEVNSL